MAEKQKAAIVCSRTTSTTTSTTRNWSELEQEILELIMKRIALVDIIHFKLVCPSWCHAANSYRSAPNYQPSNLRTPWLLLPSSEVEYQRGTCRFFSLTENKVYTFKKLITIPQCNFGSSHGWIVICDDFRSLEFYLLNPISKVRIALLALYRLPDNVLDVHELNPKFCLSSDPSCNSNFYVVISYAMYCGNGVAFYKHNGAYDIDYDNTSWTVIDEEGRIPKLHMIFHNEHLFALDLIGNLEVWDFRGANPIRNMDIHLPVGDSERSIEFRLIYMVESQGELLFMDHNFSEIYKLDFGDNKWEKMEYLQDRALVLYEGVNTSSVSSMPSISLSTRDFPLLEGNSIYIAKETCSCAGAVGFCNSYVEVLVYNIEHKCFKSYYEVRVDMVNIFSGRLIWIVPNPCDAISVDNERELGDDDEGSDSDDANYDD